MLVIEGNFAYSFLLGVLAAVNPCGFVLLPAYLMYFLGLEGTRPGSQRANVQRALVVSAATSLGFITVFLIVGTISRLFTQWIELRAKYVAFGIGVALVFFGIAMLAGWKPRFTTPQISPEHRDRTFRSMYIFGIAYAVASIGCTIGFLTTAILGTIGTKGFISGVISIVLYGLGMSLLVTALTVTLAFASTGLLTALRSFMRYADKAAAVFIILTGMYLAWYWYTFITDSTGGDAVTQRVEGWQSRVATFLQDQGAIRLAVVLGAIVLGAIVFVVVRRPRGGKPAGTDAS
jgi:cytochrome c biogenesis protein CcdA